MWKQKDKRREKAVTFYADVYRFAFKHTRDQEAAKDIAQTVMEKAIERLDQLKKEEAMKSWVMQIAFREIQSYFRVIQRYRQRVVAETEEATQHIENIADVEADVLDQLLQMESRQMAVSALLKLDEKYQDVLRLHLICEYSLHDTAQLLGLNYNTVRTRLSRGIQALRQEFSKLEREEE